MPRLSARPLLSLVLALLLALSLAPGAAEAAPKQKKRGETAEELYQQGLRAMQRGYYTRALEKFTRVRNYHRDDPLSVKAQLAIADVYFKKGDMAQARFAYEEFASYHPRHENLDYVTYRIGLSIYKDAPKFAGRDQTATRGAVNVWTGFATRFPDSEHVEEVEKLLNRSRNRLARKELHIAKHYASREAWGAVHDRTHYLVRRYPDTEPVPEALALMGRALHAWGETQQAQQILARLKRDHPETSAVHQLEGWLQRPAGEKPDEKIFVRPYKVRGGALPMM